MQAVARYCQVRALKLVQSQLLWGRVWVRAGQPSFPTLPVNVGVVVVVERGLWSRDVSAAGKKYT